MSRPHPRFGSPPRDPRPAARLLSGLGLLLWLAGSAAGFAQVDEAVARGGTWLAGQQRADGGFGPQTPLAPRNAGSAVEALLRVGGGEDAVARGLVYLAGVPERTAEFRARRTFALARGGRPVGALLDSFSEFRNGGGHGAFSRFASNAMDTSLAARALALQEPDRLLEIVPLVDFLQIGQNADGGWGYLPGDASRLYYSAEVALTLASLDRLAVAEEVLTASETFLRGAQQPDGGFGTSLETALAYRALLALGADVASLPASPVDALLAAQRADGSWGGDVFTTAQVLQALAARRPNLVPSDLQVAPKTILPGESVVVDATVTNRGAEPSPASRLAIRRDTSGGEELGSADVPALDSGQSHAVEITVTSDGATGELVLVAVADADGAVDESDEADNSLSGRVVIQSEADLALFASDLEVSPARPAPGEAFELRISARNLGETEVASFSYRVERLVAGEAVETLAQGTGGPAPPGAGTLIAVPLTLAEGEHVLRVELDPEDAVTEADESNNAAEVAFFVVDPSLPDLAVAAQDLALTPERPAAGDTVTVEAVVRNPGGSDATAAVAFYDNDPAEGGILVDRQTVTVPAGLSTELTASFTARDESRTLVVVADPDGAVEELSETNNRAAVALADLPNLAIGRDNVELAPAEPLEGETVDGAVTVRNAGTASAPEVAIAVFDGDPDAGAPRIFTGTVPALPAAGNRTVHFSWTATGGAHRLVAVADPDGTVRELSESDNRAGRRVAVPRASGPDLEPSAVDLSGFQHSAETLAASGSVSVTVSNSGDAPADAPFLVRLFDDRDGDGRFTAADRELAAASVEAALDPGASALVDLPVDATLPFHRPLLRVAVDATDVVPERDETDNLRELFGACRAAPPPASFDAEEDWFLSGLEVESAPVVVQLDDDDGDGRIDGRDVPDVVFHTEDAGGRAITARSGLDGSELWTFRSTPDHPLAGRIANLAAADVDGDGIAEVLGIQSDRRLLALDHRGRVLWTSDPVETAGGRDWAGAPAVGDLDGDGVPEIAVGRSVLSNTGRLLAQGTANVGRNHNYYGPFGVPYLIDAPLSTIADVDLDGRAELVAGDALYRLEGDTLQVVWDRTVPDELMVDGFTAVGNLDADPEAEIVYVSSNQVMVLDHDGTVARPRRVIQPIVPFGDRTFWAGPPSLGDLTGDGETEILIAAQQELFALRSDLSTLWRVPTTEHSEMTAAVPFDLDGDGADEVIVLDQSELRILDGATGTTLHARPNTSKTATEMPVVADVDNDGRAEVLVPSNRSFGGDASTQGLHVLGHPSWRGTRPVWTQHTHRGTNALLDGTVPSAEVPHWRLGAGFRSNLEVPAPERLLPNLTIGLPRVGRATEEGVPVVVRVGNGGLATVPPGAPVALFDADPSSGAAPVAEGATTAPLRPGAFEDVTVLWQEAGAAGQTAWAAVDPEDAEAECSEGDNAVDFVVEESVLPDLVVPAGGVQASGTLVVGQVVPVAVEVANAGAAEAPETIVRLFDGEPPEGRLVGEATVGPLAPGDSATAELPWDTLGSFAGLHALHAVADPDDLLVETAEGNNRGLLELELAEAASPDLAVEGFTVEPASVASGETARFESRIVNRGAPMASGFPVAFRVNRAEVDRVEVPEVLGTGEGRTVELDWSTAGRQGLLAVEAIADPDGAVAEVTEANNRAEAELSVAGPTLAVTTATDRTSYAPGDTVAVTVTAENLGDASRTAKLRVGIDDASEVRITDLEATEVTLPSGTTTFELTWETEGALPGAYAAVAELVVDGVPLARGEALFSLERQVEVEASLFADRDLYPPGASAVLTGNVANLSESTVLSELTADLRIVDSGAGEVFAATRPISALYPGSDQRLEEVWEVGTAAPGTYTAELAVRDGSGLLLAFASTSLAVEDSSETGAGLRGDLGVGPEVVGAGAPLLAELAVTNEGNADLPDLELRVDLLDLATGEAASSLSVVRPLAEGASAGESLAFDTSALPAADYLVTLVAVLPGAEVHLDRAAATVAAGISVGDAAVPEGDGGTGVLRFPVTLSEPQPEAVTVDFATADGTAEAGLDYQDASGTLTLPAGSVEGSVEVTVLGDVDPEADEVFLLTLSNATGALLGDAQALGTIEDEEGCASPDLLANGGAEEGSAGEPVAGWEEAGAGGWRLRSGDPAPLQGRAAFAAPVEAATGELVQAVDLTPFAGEIDGAGQEFLFEGFVRSAEEAAPDVAGVAVEYLDGAGALLGSFESGEVVSPGAWQAVTDLRTVPPGTRTARIRLLASRAADGASLEVSFDRLALRSVGTPTLAVGDAEVLEGDGPGTVLAFPVRLSCSLPDPVQVDFATADGTATAGEDYEAASGTLTLAAGETAGTIEVPVLGDTLDEADESLQVAISSPDEPVVLRTAVTGTIRDDDGPAVLSVADLNVPEGDEGAAEALVQVSLSAVSGKEVSASWATADGSATAGSDYQAASGTVTIPAGETVATIPVPVLGDRLNEPAEAFTVTLSAPRDAVLGDSEAQVTILDDDPVEIRVADARVVEGDGEEVAARFAVSLSVPSVAEVSVDFATEDAPSGEAAEAGVDYQATAGTLVFAPGETAAEVAVPVLGDTEKEPVETFLLALSGPVGGHPTASLADPEAVGTIVDDDGILLSVDDVSVREGPGAEATFQVSLNKATTVDVSADYRTVDGTATAGADYEAASGTVTIPAGAAAAEIPVPVLDDALYEPLQTFTLELASPSGDAVLLDPEGQATILDDDGWALNGSADDGTVEECIVLTPAVNFRRGSAWRKDRINLEQSFDKTFRVHLGDKDSNGADGLAFLLQDVGTSALGIGGSGLGYWGIDPSLAVEIDTWQNRGDPVFDHLLVNIQGPSGHDFSSSVQASSSSPNVEDGQEHTLRIIWNAPVQTLDVHFDGDERILYSRDVVTDVFSGRSDVLYGFTAGTGGANNLHYVCPTAECFGEGPSHRVSIGDVTVTEGDAGTVQAHFPVTLSCPSDEPVTVDFATEDGTAVAGEDYLPASGTLTFEPGETAKDLVVEVVGDTVGEPDEELFVVLSGPLGADLRHERGTGTIASDDAAMTLPDELVIVEGTGLDGFVTIPVTLSASLDQEVAVSWATADGTAVAGEDYVAASGEVTFPEGSTEGAIHVRLLGDAAPEEDEAFFVDVQAEPPVSPPERRVEVRIQDDDDCPSPNLLANPSGDEFLVDGEVPGWTEVVGTEWSRRRSSPSPFHGPAYFVTGTLRDDLTSELRQDVDVSGWAARIDSGEQRFAFQGFVRSLPEDPPDTTRIVLDFLDETKSQVLGTFDTGEIGNPNVWQSVGDVRTAPPGTRWIAVRLIGAYNSGNVINANFDALSLRALGTPSVAAVDAEVAEGSSGSRLVAVPIRLSCPAEAPVSVGFVTADGTALAGSDYRATSGTVEIAPGDTEAFAEVPVLGDTEAEGDETFTVRLVNPVGAALSSPEATVTILDDESELAIRDTTAVEGDAEGGLAVFTVTLTPALDQTVRVDYATADGTAEAGADYVATSGTVTFESGETTQTVEVELLGDTETEPDETFFVRLSNPVNAVLADAEGVGTIVEDDVRVSIADTQVVEGDSGEVAAVFEVTLAEPTSRRVRVDWATEDGTAVAGEDYLQRSGRVTFQPGETLRRLTVPVLGDEELEGSEVFRVVLEEPDIGRLEVGEATGLIVDDDDCPSVNLVVNGGAEESLVDGEIPGWTEVVGDSWTRRKGFPGALRGEAMFWPGDVPEAELRQDVDLADFAPFIDAGIQRFLAEGFIRSSTSDASGDPGRLIVQYLDADKETVLAESESEEVQDRTSWIRVFDLQTVPPGARWARVRLLARTDPPDGSDTHSDVYFDEVGLRSLGTPTLAMEPLSVAEGDSGSEDALLELRLSCPAPETVTVDFATEDGTALAGQDYLATSGTLVYEPGETVQTIAVPVLGDRFEEPDQDLSIHLESSGNTPLIRRSTLLTILDDDPPPFVSVEDVLVPEGAGDAVFHARLSVPSEAPVSFDVRTFDGTARRGSDYTFTSGTVTFGSFEREQQIRVPILDDAEAEPDEDFRLGFSSPDGLILLDNEGRATILDDDAGASCDGPDLLTNGGGEDLPLGDSVPGWTVVDEDGWSRRTGDPAPDEGFAYLAAPATSSAAELVQDVDLTAYAPWIDASGQELRFEGRVRSGDEDVADRARIILEYLDGSGAVLDAFDSGWLSSPSAWEVITDERFAPAGTRTARVRLLAERETGETTDVFFDGLALRSLGTPTLWVEDVFATEGSAPGTARFRLRLSCPAPGPVEVEFQTADGTATAGADYRAESGVVTFEPGDMLHEVEVGLIDDSEPDPGEHFELRLVLTGEAALVTPAPRAFIADDDSIGLDLALCLDSSGSISRSEFALQIGGTAAAVEDPTVIPHNGTVRLSVLRFAGGVQYPVPPVVIDRQNAADVAQQIRSLFTGTGGGTNMAACLDLATQVITQATPFSAKQVIDVSTDGFPNNAGATLESADAAVDEGIDVINAIGVGSGVGEAFLDQMVRPQPSGGAEGFVVLVDSFDEYAEAIAQKLRKEANPDLVVSKTDGRDTVSPGELLEYTVTVTNTGSGAVASVVVEDDLPAALLDPVFTPSAGSFDEESGVWTGISLDTDDVVTLTVAAQVDPAAAGTLVNTVTVSPPEGVTDVEPGDNTASDTTDLAAVADLALDKSDDGPFAAGEAGVYRLTVTNHGPSSAAGPVQVTDSLPEGLDFVAADGDGWACSAVDPGVTCEHAGPLRAGESLPEISLEVAVGPAAVPEVTNTAEVSSPTEDPEPGNDTASRVTSVEGPVGEPELTATKTDSLALDADGDEGPSPGDEIAYEVEVTNSGGAPATEVVFRDLPPEHASIVAGSLETSAGAVLTGDPVEVDLGTLEAGASATVTFRVAVDLPVPAGVDRISNQGTVTSAELPAVLTDDPDAGGDADPTVTMISAAPELVAEKTDRLAADRDGDGEVSPGDDVEYTVTVRNAGNTSATGVFLADPVPEHTAVVPGSVEASAGTVTDEDPVQVDLGELAGGDTVEIRFRVRIENPIAAGVREIENQALVTSAELPDVVSDDPEVDGAADATVTPVTAAPELLVEKTDVLFDDPAEDGLASPGDVLLYRVTVANAGNTAATAVVLTDPLPEHTTLETDTVQASGGAVVAEDPVTVELGQVDVETEAVVTFQARIDEPFPLDVLEVVNQAEVASAEVDPVPSDDPETAEEGDPTATEVFIIPEVTVDDVAVEEAAGAATGAVFTVTLSEASNRPVRLPYATADGPGEIPPPAGTSPATAGLDYQPASGTLVLEPGETEAQVAVEVLDDLLDELDETFTLELGEPEGGVLLRGAGLGTILDDDPPPFVSVGDATVTEGDPGDGAVELVFPVTLSGPSGLGISVDYATDAPLAGRPAEPGEDFEPVSGSLSFPAGTTAATVAVPVLPDRIDELDETLRLVLSNPVAVLLEDADGLGTIVDDDEARISIDHVSVEEGDSGTADALVPVRLEVPADREITVRYATAAGTATEDEDFLVASGVLAFPAGATEGTVPVPVVGDELLEPLEESLTVELSEPTETTIEDGTGRLTIVDDEDCPGPELLANPGAEDRPDFGAEPGDLPGWTEVEGEAWQRRFTDPEPAEGEAFFYAGEVEAGELSQEVSVRAYEVRIADLEAPDGSVDARLDEGQRFAVSARVRTFEESPPDTARVVVEYRDGTNAVVLDAFDSGEIASPHEWREVRDVRAAPAGTGWIRVRLVATRFAGQSNDGYFDAVSLRSLRTPTLTVSDVTVFEGDSGETPADFVVRLACPFHREVTVSYATADGPSEGGATAPSDYRAVSGSLIFAPGETEATVSVPVLGDTVHEPHETFFLELSDAAPAEEVVLLDPRGTGLIVNDDFCPRSPGFWKTHRELWPTDWLDLGGVAYGAEELQGFLEAKGGDMTLHLARQLVATKLNLLVGSDPEILPVVDAADEYLAAFPPGSNPKGQDRKAGEELKDALDDYNNSPCQETPVIPE